VSEEGRCPGWRTGKCTLLPVILDHEEEDYYSHLIGGVYVHDGGQAEEGGWRRSRVQGDVFGSATRSSSVGKVCSGGGGECCGPCKYTCPDCGMTMQASCNALLLKVIKAHKSKKPIMVKLFGKSQCEEKQAGLI